MPTLLRQPSMYAALIAASIGLSSAPAPAFAARADSTFVVETCPKKGRDPIAAMFTHSCGVGRPGGITTSTPPWAFLELMAIDGNVHGGAVVVTLQCMSLASGRVSAVARVASVPSSTPKKVAAPLPAPLNFERCAYFVDVDVDGTKSAVQALMVSLRN